MTSPIIISQRVINTIKALPDDDRRQIAAALASEILLNDTRNELLTPVQEIIVSMLRSYVVSDTRRFGQCAGLDVVA